jgi:hypothetical protein
MGAEDPRTMDARRADLLVGLLTGQLVAGADLTFVDDGADDGRTRGNDDSNATDPAHPTAESAQAAESPQAAESTQAVESTQAAEATSPTGAAEATTTGAEAGGPAAGADGAGACLRDGRGLPVRPVTPGKPLIQIVMADSTLLGADDRPAELVGHGPIPAPLAREIAADAVWRRLVTDPLSGTVLDYGRTTYHPPAGLADHVRARDRYCRFPLCRRKAADAELDHALAWADGGTTSAGNLHALCLHHHKLKHHAGWRIEAHPDGRLTWMTPTGHRHTTRPHDHRPEPPPPPAPTRQGPDPDPPPF